MVVAAASIALVLVVVAVVGLLAPAQPSSSDSSQDASPGTNLAGITVPAQAAPPALAANPGPGFSGQVDLRWARDVAAATGIPERAVVGYAAGALGAEHYFPGCGIGWNTLAGIGRIESDHGRHGGGVIDETGLVLPLIFGVQLDGDGVQNIPDTDGGAYDEDAEFDRAMGPMQFIPRTWISWAVDANGDLNPDPHNINDAALAAGDYLCFMSGGMSTEEGYLAGIAAYNAGEVYLRNVTEAAQRYGDAAASATD